MPRPLIAVTDSPFPSLDPAKAALARVDPELRMAKSPSAEDILAVARDADAVLVTYAKLPGDLLRQLTRCKAIGRFGLGVDNIDISAAATLGITVTYVPDYCMQVVSDHAMALLLALVRKVPLSNKLVQSGRWEVPPIVPIHRLNGRVLGLVGFGNIPRALAPKAKAFGLRVVTYDPYAPADVLAEAGVEGDARAVQRRCLRQDESGRVPGEHRARTAGGRGRADCRARFRQARRRRARRGDDGAAGEGLEALGT
jgi:D-3-phosphoglycerate dehydrogenase